VRPKVRAAPHKKAARLAQLPALIKDSRRRAQAQCGILRMGVSSGGDHTDRTARARGDRRAAQGSRACGAPARAIAATRSAIRLRSSSATAPSTVKIILPIGVIRPPFLRPDRPRSPSSRRWRLNSKTTTCPALCRRTFLFASSESGKKPSTIRQNTVGYGTSKCDCGERRMRFISRLATPARGLTLKGQRRAEGLASQAWRSD
jgi:hypothetical protein